jgi:hypothetical protein
MPFAQLTFRESLRDIEVCLRAQSSKLYHLGIRSAVARNTLANANPVRDWRIYADFAQSLIARNRLRARHYDYRSVSVRISVGGVPHGQCSDQAAYAARSAGQYPHLHSHHRYMRVAA